MTDEGKPGSWVRNRSRRELLALVGGAAAAVATAAGGLWTFKPEVLVGHPRGEGAPISVDRTITDDSVEYRPNSDTVRWPRYSAAEGGTEVEPFEAWARRRCAVVAADSVLPAVRERVDGELSGVGKGASGEIIGLVVTVHVGTAYEADGDVVDEPSISKRELVAVTPRTVHTTITFEGRSHTRAVPVFVEEMDTHQL